MADDADVVFALFIRNVNGPTGDAASGSVKGTIWVSCLEHIPVWEDIELRGEGGVVGVPEDMPGLGSFRKVIYIIIRWDLGAM